MKTSKIVILFIFISLQSMIAQKSKNVDVDALKFNPLTNCLLRYYYYPNLEAYFDSQENIYYYKENSTWVAAEEIPNGYRGYSVYNKIRVPVKDYDDDYVCQFIEIHKKKYPYIVNERGKQLTVSNK